MLKSLRRKIKDRPAIFTREQIDQMYDELLPLTDVTSEEKEKHIETIQEYKESKKEPSPAPSKPEPEPEKPQEKPATILCPKCGAPMILRTASKGANQGKQFYGCSNFPKCRKIVNLTE